MESGGYHTHVQGHQKQRALGPQIHLRLHEKAKRTLSSSGSARAHGKSPHPAKGPVGASRTSPESDPRAPAEEDAELAKACCLKLDEGNSEATAVELLEREGETPKLFFEKSATTGRECWPKRSSCGPKPPPTPQRQPLPRILLTRVQAAIQIAMCQTCFIDALMFLQPFIQNIDETSTLIRRKVPPPRRDRFNRRRPSIRLHTYAFWQFHLAQTSDWERLCWRLQRPDQLSPDPTLALAKLIGSSSPETDTAADCTGDVRVGVNFPFSRNSLYWTFRMPWLISLGRGSGLRLPASSSWTSVLELVGISSWVLVRLLLPLLAWSLIGRSPSFFFVGNLWY